MNRRNILSLSVVTTFGFAVCSGNAFAQQKSIKDQLVGTWTVTSQEQARKDGSKVERFGANPKGITIFEANGRFATILARADLPKLASNDPMKPSPAEAMALAVGSVAYFGTYTVDEPSKTILLKIEASTLPNQLGFEGKRVINTLTADELKYTNTTAVGDLGPVVTSHRRAK
jgi:Lipocalin-like domain